MPGIHDCDMILTLKDVTNRGIVIIMTNPQKQSF